MSNLVILKCDTNAKFEKNAPFSLVQIAIFNIFFKTIERSFEDLEFDSN